MPPHERSVRSMMFEGCPCAWVTIGGGGSRPLTRRAGAFSRSPQTSFRSHKWATVCGSGASELFMDRILEPPARAQRLYGRDG